MHRLSLAVVLRSFSIYKRGSYPEKRKIYRFDMHPKSVWLLGCILFLVVLINLDDL